MTQVYGQVYGLGYMGNALKYISIAISALLWFSMPAISHEIQPAVADLTFDDGGGYTLSIVLNLEAVMAEIEPEVSDTSQSKNASEYDRMRALPPTDLENDFSSFSTRFLNGLHLKADGTPIRATVEKLIIPDIGDLDFTRESIIVLHGQLPANAKTFTWGWDSKFGASIIRIVEENENDTYSAYLIPGTDSDPLAISGARTRGFIETVTSYIVVGYVHIVPKGLDHILFVIGLFLLSTRLHPLLWQITAFTVAHTISLALGITGLVVVSPAIVEPLIALSIVYVAVENLFTQKLTRWRPFVVFGFGLLHGLGFAGVLKEIGLPTDQFVVGLVSFNVGVELGQLSVIAACFLIFGLWFSKKPYYHKFFVVPGSLAIGAMAFWWFIERTFLT